MVEQVHQETIDQASKVFSIRDFINKEYLKDSLYKWQYHGGIVISIYRIVAFIIAGLLTFAFETRQITFISPTTLFVVIGIYTLIQVLPLPRRNPSRKSVYITLGIDVCVCIFLSASTGGVSSPYFMYSLTPALTGASILSYFLLYGTAVGLITMLPKPTNLTVGHLMADHEIAQERRIFYRELHDGAAQTTAALSWRVQVFRRRLDEMHIDLNEFKEVEWLSKKAQYEVRQTLELLNNFAGYGSFLNQVKEYLENFKESTDINYKLETEKHAITFGAMTEFQLMGIIHEALSNVQKHSKAQNVLIAIKLINGQVELSIVDDGKGFDVPTFNTRQENNGLSKMKQRSESIKAKFQIISSPEKGTRVQVTLPSMQEGEYE